MTTCNATYFGSFFAPLPAEDESSAQVPLAELGGLTPELVAILGSAGYNTLGDILDLEREDIQRVPGMTPEAAEQVMAVMAELTTDEGEEPPPAA